MADTPDPTTLLAEVEALDKAATPGPWELDPNPDVFDECGEFEACISAPGDVLVLTAPTGVRNDATADSTKRAQAAQAFKDGRFAARARTLLPKLAEALRYWRDLGADAGKRLGVDVAALEPGTEAAHLLSAVDRAASDAATRRGLRARLEAWTQKHLSDVTGPMVDDLVVVLQAVEPDAAEARALTAEKELAALKQTSEYTESGYARISKLVDERVAAEQERDRARMDYVAEQHRAAVLNTERLAALADATGLRALLVDMMADVGEREMTHSRHYAASKQPADIGARTALEMLAEAWRPRIDAALSSQAGAALLDRLRAAEQRTEKLAEEATYYARLVSTANEERDAAEADHQRVVKERAEANRAQARLAEQVTTQAERIRDLVAAKDAAEQRATEAEKKETEVRSLLHKAERHATAADLRVASLEGALKRLLDAWDPFHADGPLRPEHEQAIRKEAEAALSPAAKEET